MSAINPASFASPTLGLQAPSGIGPGAVGVGRGSVGAERRETRPQQEPQQQQPQQQQQQQPTSYSGPGASAGRGFPSSFNQGFAERVVPTASGYPQQGYPYSQYAAFNNGPRSSNLPYMAGVMPGMESYQPGFSQPGEFAPPRARFPNPQAGNGAHDQGLPPMAAQADWVGTFQGLSLSSR